MTEGVDGLLQRIWAAHGLKPHRVKTFKLSTDPRFATKVQDVVGLYVDPPEHALVPSSANLDNGRPIGDLPFLPEAKEDIEILYSDPMPTIP
jgi:hypothetical protein